MSTFNSVNQSPTPKASIRTKFLQALKSRFPETVSYLYVSRYYLKRLVKPRQRRDWYEAEVEISARSRLGDFPTALFTSIILEFGHNDVIEIGAFDGSRIIDIKKLAPRVNAFGLDIGASYDRSYDMHNVNFTKLDMDFFDRQFDNPIVLAVNTFSQMKQQELIEFLHVLRTRKIPVAFFDIVPYFDMTREDSIKRGHGKHGFYHPYKRIFEKIGYKMFLDTQGNRWSHNSSPKTLETICFDYAVIGDE